VRTTMLGGAGAGTVFCRRGQWTSTSEFFLRASQDPRRSSSKQRASRCEMTCPEYSTCPMWELRPRLALGLVSR
jgi:hypothetical protein